jgi:hypothetical protein
MAALTTQNIVDAGTAPTFAAAATSDTAEIGTGTNTSNAKTITITVPGNTSYGEPNPDPVLNLGANTGELLIPLRKLYDAGDGTGRATLTVGGTGGVTGVTVSVQRVG